MLDKDKSGEQYLMERLAVDDHEAFGQIYEIYWKQLLHTAWAHTKDQVLAEDIVHDVFMRLWANRNHSQIKNVEAFLRTAVKYTIFEHYRKEKRRKELAEENLTIADFSDDEAGLDAIFMEQYINALLERMPDKPRLVFKYSRRDGLKNAEIATLMNISEKGVEANLTRALKFLKSHMKRDGLVVLLIYDILKDYVSE